MPEGGRTLREWADALGADLEGERPGLFSRLQPLESAGPEDLSFLHQGKYLSIAQTSRAGAIIAPRDVAFWGAPLLRCDQPYAAFAKALHMLHPPRAPRPGLHPAATVDASARVDPSAEVGPYAVVGPGCTVGAGVTIHPHVVLLENVQVGEGSILYPRVTCYPGTRVGPRNILHAGVVLGSDGFGFAPGAAGLEKVPQVGWVETGADVEIGANTTVDRGTLEPTRIGDNTKVDNLVQIGHNVQTGRSCILVAQSGISGSTVLEDGVVIAGQSGAVGHIRLHKGARVAAKTAVTKDVPAGQTVSGNPAVEHRLWLRAQALFLRLPELFARLKKLEERDS